MEQIFTPNTKLDVSEVASNANGLELRGIVNYSQSQCSLDLTQNALRYGTNKNSPTNKTGNVSKIQQVAFKWFLNKVEVPHTIF